MIVNNKPMLIMVPEKDSNNLEAVMNSAGFHKSTTENAGTYIKEADALSFTENDALMLSQQIPDTSLIFQRAFTSDHIEEESYHYSKSATSYHSTRYTNDVFICKNGKDVLKTFTEQLSEDIAGNRFSLDYRFAKDLKSLTFKGTYETHTNASDGYMITNQTPFHADVVMDKPLDSLHVSFQYDL